MISLYEVVNESMMVCEAFKERHIYQAWKTIHAHNIKWKDIFPWNLRVKWDAIGPESVETIDIADIEDELTKIRRLKMGYDKKGFLIFGFKDEELECIFEPRETSIFILRVTSGDWYHQDANSARAQMNQRDQINILKKCDYLVKVWIDGFSTEELRKMRSQMKADWYDMTDNDHNSKHLSKGELGKSAGGRSDYVSWDSYYAHCQKMAQEAVSKWKEIIAQNKFKKDASTQEVDDAVNGILARVTKFASLVTKGDTGLSTYDFERVISLIYDMRRVTYSGSKGTVTGRDGLMVLYKRYCAAVIDLQQALTKGVSRYGWHNSEDDIKARDAAKKAVLDMVKEIDEKFKKYGA